MHGFGFAGALADLGLPAGSLALSLAGFNVGVELGQLAIVAVFLPLAYAMRNTWTYRRVIFAGGSAAIAAIAIRVARRARVRRSAARRARIGALDLIASRIASAT